MKYHNNEISAETARTYDGRISALDIVFTTTLLSPFIVYARFIANRQNHRGSLDIQPATKGLTPSWAMRSLRGEKVGFLTSEMFSLESWKNSFALIRLMSVLKFV